MSVLFESKCKTVYVSNSRAIYIRVVCLVIRISIVLADTSNKLAGERERSSTVVYSLIACFKL